MMNQIIELKNLEAEINRMAKDKAKIIEVAITNGITLSCAVTTEVEIGSQEYDDLGITGIDLLGKRAKSLIEDEDGPRKILLLQCPNDTDMYHVYQPEEELVYR